MTISGADRGAIMDLQARYVHLYDSGDFEGWIQCFAEDGIYEAPTLADRQNAVQANRTPTSVNACDGRTRSLELAVADYPARREIRFVGTATSDSETA